MATIVVLLNMCPCSERDEDDLWSWLAYIREEGGSTVADILSGGGDKYDVTVESEGGNKLRFATEREPRAIWCDRGVYYVACSSLGDDWLLARLESNGTLTPVLRKDLPEGNISWNLVDPTKQVNWQKKFDLWAQ